MQPAFTAFLLFVGELHGLPATVDPSQGLGQPVSPSCSSQVLALSLFPYSAASTVFLFPGLVSPSLAAEKRSVSLLLLSQTHRSCWRSSSAALRNKYGEEGYKNKKQSKAIRALRNLIVS